MEAYENGNYKWYIPFKTIDNVLCEIRIYQDGYSGTPIQVTPADSPFIYQEDDTDNLLEPIRVKTGYIRVIEEVYGSLSEMNPSTDISHFVTVTLGGDIIFIGFMKAQNFNNKYEPGPHILEFPVQSPLGITTTKKMTWRWNERYTTIAHSLRLAIDSMDAGIKYIYFPDYITSSTVRTLSLYINSLSFYPFNEDIDINDRTSPLHVAETVSDFLEEICRCFGLVLHDLGVGLVFTKYDYEGIYSRYDVESISFNNLDNIDSAIIIDVYSGSSIWNMQSLQPRSDNNIETVIQPASEIQISYKDKLYPEYEIPYQRTYIIGYSTWYALLESRTTECVCYLFPSSDYTFPLPQQDITAMYGVGRRYDEHTSFEDMIAFARAPLSDSTNVVFTWRLYNVPRNVNNNYIFTFQLVNPYNHYSITGNANIPVSNVQFGIKMKNGNYYRQDDGSWDTSETTIFRTTDDNGFINIRLNNKFPVLSKWLEITFIINPEYFDRHNDMWAFKDIKIRPDVKAMYQYRGIEAFADDKRDKPRIISSDNGSQKKINIEQGLTIERNTDNSIINSDGTFTSVVPTNYNYMFVAQHRIRFDTYINPQAMLYMPKVLLGNSIKKRIVGIDYDVRNKVVTLTAQGSSTLN